MLAESQGLLCLNTDRNWYVRKLNICKKRDDAKVNAKRVILNKSYFEIVKFIVFSDIHGV